jgi:preprotein translocase subunit SecY
VQVYPPYRERVRELDRKVTWITVILVLYLVGNFIYIIFFR